MTIFLTRSRHTQKKIFNDFVTVPEATYSGGDSSSPITDQFSRMWGAGYRRSAGVGRALGVGKGLGVGVVSDSAGALI